MGSPAPLGNNETQLMGDILSELGTRIMLQNTINFLSDKLLEIEQ